MRTNQRLRTDLGTALLLLIGSGLTSAQEPEPVAGDGPRGLIKNEAGAYPGYTLISPLLSESAFLLDMQGKVVHEWKTGRAPGGGFYLLENGHLLRCARIDENPVFKGGGIGGLIQELDWDGSVVWQYEIANEYQTQHHDMAPMPNGNVLVIVWEHRYREDALEFGREPEAVDAEGFWPDAVLELKPIPPDDAEVVWEWHVWDHLIQDFDHEKTNFSPIALSPERLDINAEHRDRPPLTAEDLKEMNAEAAQMAALGYGGAPSGDGPGVGDRRSTAPDWLHTNGIAYEPEHDLIVLSSPHLCEVLVIDHSTTTEEASLDAGGRWGRGGDLLFRWGNPRNYGAGTGEDQRLFYQHDPTWVRGQEPGELRLLVFNNGGGRPSGEDYSSVDELVLPFDPKTGFQREPGEPFGPRKLAWRYADKGNFFSGFISGAQRLPNGNTLICSGAPGRVFEVTSDGTIVWEYRNEHGGEVAPSATSPGAPPKALFRATRIGKDDPALVGRF